MWFRLVKLAIWIAVIFAGICFWKYLDFQKTPLTTEVSTVTVVPGATFRSVLMDAGAPEMQTKLYLRRHTPDFELQAGSYTVPANATPEIYIQNLKTAISNDISLTFLEGWNIFDIDEKLTQSGLIQSGEFIDFAENYCDATLYPGSRDTSGNCLFHTQYPYLEGLTSLEGYLYPDTYAINPNTFTVKTLSEKMLGNFTTKVYAPLFHNAGNDTVHDTVTLASIVEKEEKNVAEKPTVAGILQKRLDEGWMLGADITVCYAHRLTSEECKLSVTKYLYDENEYNTRQKVGLPAGPIGNPSAQTIEATLNFKETPYYYYLHDVSTGEIYYGVTEADHNANKAKYIQ